MMKEFVVDELESRGIIVPKGHGRFKGLNPDNICNRGANKKGCSWKSPGICEMTQKKDKNLGASPFAPIGMLEFWNSGIMGSGIMQCWINGPAAGRIDDRIKMVNILFKTNIPSFHHSIIPFP